MTPATPQAPLKADPLEPVPTGDFLVWHVRSEVAPEVVYRVDMEANAGNGWCSCRDHQTRRQPAIDAGAPGHTDATLCKHQKRVRDYVFARMCRDFALSRAS